MARPIRDASGCGVVQCKDSLFSLFLKLRPSPVPLDLSREFLLGQRMFLHFFYLLDTLLGVLWDGVCQFSHVFKCLQ